MSVTTMTEQDLQIAEVVEGQGARLRSFIRKRVANDADVDELLQEVFYELVAAKRFLLPIDYVTGWLYRVARNRITDLFRKKKPANFTDIATVDDDGELLAIEELLPSPDAGPDAEYRRKRLLAELERAVAALPEEWRTVFVAHELEGQSFKEMAAATGININTLLSRKRYAVQQLRRRLSRIHDEMEEGMRVEG